MKLRILGCSGGIGGELRTTSLLVDDEILIDAGTGVGDLSLREMAAIRHVFLTHSHLDHIACLPLMIDSVFPHITDPIVVHGQLATVEILKKHVFNWAVWPDFARLPTEAAPVMRYQAHKPGEAHDLGGRRFEMIPVNHIVPTVGYTIACDTGVAAFSGDTTTNDTFWDALNRLERLDLMIVEVAFPDALRELAVESRHYCPALLADDLRKLRHRPAIYLTHNKPGDEALIFDQCRRRVPDRDLQRLRGGQLLEI